MDSEEISVNDLIGSLCVALCKDGGTPVTQKLLKACKIRAFEIILKKSSSHTIYNVDENLNIDKEVMYYLFDRRLKTTNSIKTMELDKLEQELKVARETDYFQTDEGTNVLKFLLQMADSKANEPTGRLADDVMLGRFIYDNVSKNVNSFIMSNEKLPNLIGKLNSSKDKNPYLSLVSYVPINFSNPQEPDNTPSVFGSVSSLIACNNQKSQVSQQSKYFIDTKEMTSSSWRPTISRINSNFEKTDVGNELDPNKSNSNIIIYSNMSQYSNMVGVVQTRNWENLGKSSIVGEIPFATDSFSLFHMASEKEAQFGELFTANVVSQYDFIRDLKSLTIGIQSESFILDANGMFSLTPYITIENVLPETLANICSELQVCGTCFRRLQLMVTRDISSFKYDHDGIIFESLCVSVEKFLIMFRQYVLEFEDEMIMQFLSRVSVMVSQLVGLARILGLHPRFKKKEGFINGSDFFGYLYKEIIDTNDKDLCLLFIYIMRHCCEVYFRKFQKWIYRGMIDLDDKELFIFYNNSCQDKINKQFFDTAYGIRQDAVPGFLQGHEHEILTCGKYMMLLKTFNPNHPLLEVMHPKFRVCLTDVEIDELKVECNEYKRNVERICGEPILIKKVLMDRAKQKVAFAEMMKLRCQVITNEWKAKQQQMILERNERKREAFLDMQQQIDESRNSKILKRKNEIIEEREYLRIALEAEDKQLLKEASAREKRIEYYKELHELIERNKVKDIPRSTVIPEGESITNRTEEYFDCETDLEKVSPGSDYKSIKGTEINDDEKSDYGEPSDNISPEFIDEFKKSEEVLQNSALMSNSLRVEISEPSLVLPECDTADILNSNDILFDFQRNRSKVMASSIGFDTPGEPTISNVQKTMTECQRNKMKVLNAEYGIFGDCDNTKTTMDINSNPPVVKLNDTKINAITNAIPQLTELQQNKINMLSTDAQRHSDKVIESHRTVELTAAQKNKLKVLSSEYGVGEDHKDLKNNNKNLMKTSMSLDFDNKISKMDYLVPDKQKQIEAPCTPMSTNSDTPITETIEQISEVQSVSSYNESQTELVTSTILDNEDEVLDLNPYRQSSKLLLTTFNLQHESRTQNFFPLWKRDEEATNEKIDYAIDEQPKHLNGVTLSRYLELSFVLPLKVHQEAVNNEVLKIFLKQLDILGHFKSLRNYFFLMDGEFTIHLCDTLIEKIENKIPSKELLKYQVLHATLEKALNCTASGKDPNSKYLSFMVTDIPENFELNQPDTMNMLNLIYRVEWPLNLVLSQRIMDQYVNVFKYLLKVRRIGWIMENLFEELRAVTKNYGSAALKSFQYRKIQLVRHKFLQFIQTWQNHITSNAIQSSWKTFKDSLQKVKSVEELFKAHASYVKRVIFLCLLNKQSAIFLSAIEDFFKVAIRFARHLQSKMWQYNDVTGDLFHPHFEKILNDEKDFERVIRYVIYLGNKIVRQGYQVEIESFINLININDYYNIEQ